jgi:hypothetical protein
MAAVDSVQAAGNILSIIADTNVSENNLKVVYSIYQQTWMQGVYEFSSTDSLTLYNIATQHASDAGEAVYAARVMLDMQVDEFSANNQRLSPELTDERDEPSVTLFPNPASNKVNVQISLEDGQLALVAIIDLQGKAVVESTVVSSEVFALDVSSLEAGFYFVQTTINGELIETNKLEIIQD